MQAEDASQEALRPAVLLHQPAAGPGAVSVNRTAFRLHQITALWHHLEPSLYISTFSFLVVRVTRWPGLPPAVHERNHAVRLAAHILQPLFRILCHFCIRYVFVRPIMAIISLLAFAIPPHVYAPLPSLNDLM